MSLVKVVHDVCGGITAASQYLGALLRVLSREYHSEMILNRPRTASRSVTGSEEIGQYFSYAYT